MLEPLQRGPWPDAVRSCLCTNPIGAVEQHLVARIDILRVDMVLSGILKVVAIVTRIKIKFAKAALVQAQGFKPHLLIGWVLSQNN